MYKARDHLGQISRDEQTVSRKKWGGKGHVRNRHQYVESIGNPIAYVATGVNLLTTIIHT